MKRRSLFGRLAALGVVMVAGLPRGQALIGAEQWERNSLDLGRCGWRVVGRDQNSFRYIIEHSTAP